MVNETLSSLFKIYSSILRGIRISLKYSLPEPTLLFGENFEANAGALKNIVTVTYSPWIFSIATVAK